MDEESILHEGGTVTPESAKEQGRRPTPVRMVMEGGDEGTDGSGEVARTFHEARSGQEWVVSVVGYSASGVLPLRSVPILELSFARADAPDRQLRSAIHFGTALENLSDQEVLECFHRARPFREALRGPDEADRKGRGRKARGRQSP